MNDFLVFSDLHLHNWKYGSQTDRSGYNTRLLDQVAVMAQIYGYAEEHDIKLVMFCGDLFHTHQTLHAGPLALAAKFFRAWDRKEIHTWMIPGNHDMADREGKITSLEALGDVVTLRNEDNRGFHNIFNFLPYTQDPDRIKKFLDQLPNGSYGFMHSGIQKVAVNHKGFVLNDEILDPEWISDRVNHVFVGHYHSFHQERKWTIPGSPMHYGFGDAGDSRGFLHVSPEQNRILAIGLDYPNFKVLDGTRKLQQDEVMGHYIKLTGIQPNHVLADELKQMGARTVEFEVSGMAAVPELPGQQANVTIENVVRKFIEMKNLPQELVDVGAQIMEGRGADNLS